MAIVRRLLTAILVITIELSGRTVSIYAQPTDMGVEPLGKRQATRTQTVISKRPLLPIDLFTVRDYVDKKESPDGEMIALEIHSLVKGASCMRDSYIVSNQRSEIWIAHFDGREPLTLTHQRPLKLSQWHPVWSPNGDRLAFFSNEGQRNGFLEVWDVRTRRIRRLGTAAVDQNIGIGRTTSRRDFDRILWLDDLHVMAALLPNGYGADLFETIAGPERLALQGAIAVTEGRRSTAIAVSSPLLSPDLTGVLESELVVFDVRTGHARVLGRLPFWRNGVRAIVVSPHHSSVAVIATLPPGSMDSNSKVSAGEFCFGKVGVARLGKDEVSIRWINGLQPAMHDCRTTIRWNGDDEHFAIVGQDQAPDAKPYLALVDANTTELTSTAVLDEQQFGTDNGMDILDTSWLPDGRSVVQVLNSRTKNNGDTLVPTWWAVSGGSAKRLSPEEEAEVRQDSTAGTHSKRKLETSKTGRLYATDPAGRDTTIFPDLNPQLAEIDDPQMMNFEYKTTTGQTLYANLLLPYHYERGKRYPTVVKVYGGDMHSKDEKAPNPEDELTLLTGKGYAVLRPSMPMSPVGEPTDPMLQLRDGVDPAIDRAIDLGIVDKDRIAVMGDSYGGYSVLGLLTQSARYRAGIAMMCVSDLSRMYGEMTHTLRYFYPHASAYFGPYEAESQQLRMGVPPWVDPQRYVRNSPFFNANRITTPVLLVSGDLDDLASESDAMFIALDRQGKQVEYVRYLGEEHGLHSPANVLDLWQRIFSYLETHLKKASVLSQSMAGSGTEIPALRDSTTVQ